MRRTERKRAMGMASRQCTAAAMMIAMAIATHPISTPMAVFWSSSSSFQREPGVMRSKRTKPTMKSRMPINAKMTAAATFETRFDRASGVMSFASRVPGSEVVIVRTVRAGVVAYGPGNVLHFRRPRQRPAAPIGGGGGGDEQEAEGEIQGVTHGEWSGARRRRAGASG